MHVIMICYSCYFNLMILLLLFGITIVNQSLIFIKILAILIGSIVTIFFIFTTAAHLCTSKFIFHTLTGDLASLLLTRTPYSWYNFWRCTGKFTLLWIGFEIYSKLGPPRADALPWMHAISGADVLEAFSGKTKSAFWSRLMDANHRVLQALSSLGRTFSLTDEIYSRLEEYLCSVYLKEPLIEKLCDLRWWLFSRKQFKGQLCPLP